MKRIVSWSLIAMLPGCAAALDESSFAGLSSAPDEVLVYEGSHWRAETYVDEVGEEEILFGACAGADGLQTDRFFEVVIDLAPECADAEPVSYQASFGIAGLERNGTKLAFTSVVHVSRDGLLFVEDGEWSAYAGGPPSAPAWTGDLGGDGVLTLTSPVDAGSFDGETWSLAAGPLDASTGCPAGELEGTVAHPDGSTCLVTGTLTFTPVRAEPRDGAVYLTNLDGD